MSLKIVVDADPDNLPNLSIGNLELIDLLDWKLDPVSRLTSSLA